MMQNIAGSNRIKFSDFRPSGDSVCLCSRKWIIFLNQGRIRQRKEKDGSTSNMLRLRTTLPT